MITTADERAVLFDHGDIQLAGIVTYAPDPNGCTVMLPWGGGAFPSSGKARIRVRMARIAAEAGYHAMRFDYAGVGESGGAYVWPPNLKNPYVAEIVSAYRWLASQGHERVVIVANCLGAYSSLLAAPEIAGLEGMAVVRAPTRRGHWEVAAAQRSLREWGSAATRFKPRYLLDERRRRRYRAMVGAKVRALLPGSASSRGDSPFARSVRHLLQRDIPLLFLYRNVDDFHDDFVRELDAGLRADLEAAGPLTRVVLTDARLDGFATIQAQAFVRQEVTAWLRELAVR